MAKALDIEGLMHLRDILLSLMVGEREYTYKTTEKAQVVFTLPAFDALTDSIEVYVNGLRLISSVEYTVAGNKVTIVAELERDNLVHFIQKSFKLPGVT